MTAIIAVTQRDRAHLAADAATYTPDGEVAGFRSKVDAVPQWPGALATLGNAAMSPLLARWLALEFRTWDDLIAGAESFLPGVIDALELPSGADIVMVGHSRKRGMEAWTFRSDDALPPGTTAEEAELSPYRAKRICQLVRLPPVIMSPTANDQVIPAHFEGIDPNADSETLTWSIRKWFQMAKQTQLPDGVGSIGGFASMTTVHAGGLVESRIIANWPEDSTGGPLRPWPIDWAQWHRENPKPKPGKKFRVVR